MSIARINQYYNEVFEAQSFAGATKETSIKRYFANLVSDYLKMYFKDSNKRLIDEVKLPNLRKQPDGAIIDNFNFNYGYWEAKDEQDKLKEELQKKINIGYPTDNLLIQNSSLAILVRGEVKESYEMQDAKTLDKLLRKWLSYERIEAINFRDALDKFKKDVPQIVKVLQGMIEEQINPLAPLEGGTIENSPFEKGDGGITSPNPFPRGTGGSGEFIQKRKEFLAICRTSINPQIDFASVDEMLIQHILTEEIFKTVFNDTQFHEENNIAQILTALEKTFFVGQTKRQTLASIQAYYEAIKAHSQELHSHEQKQDFLKSVYESFYQAYNPKSADKLGIVYTPSEIVKFMIESTDYLLEQNFNKNLSDKGVEILDPATGTGTFITDLIKYLAPQNLLYKYKHEIHANEVAILPYYIANLNIEYIFNQKMRSYQTFDNLCWVDTLDNLGGMQMGWRGKNSGYEVTGDLFAVSAENAQRIKNQNSKRISVIIGNPPYNANQQNENDNNKNREYKDIDRRIKDTFIKESTAQKTKVYDMYARFYRWAMDRIDNQGIVSFITNRSFIDSRTFDGFRKIVQAEFDLIYIIDTKSDVRQNPKIAGTTHNVFGIQTGVALMFLVKTGQKVGKTAKVYYATLTDEMRKEEKLQWFKENTFRTIDFEKIIPDKKANWINLSESNFEELIPVCNKEVKGGKGGNAIFQMFSLGVVTNRDEWVYDFDKENLKKKVNFLIDKYNQEVDRLKGTKKENVKDEVEYSIKWTRAVKNDLAKGKKYVFDETKIIETLYRPFFKQNLYFSKELNEMQYQMPNVFGELGQKENKVICFSISSRIRNYSVLVTNQIPSLALYVEPSQCLPLYRYENGEQKENISDWALELFRQTYKVSKNLIGLIQKEDIFHYVYAVLHQPEYRKKYELDLKRDFPRIPLYPDFWKYAEAGKKLMDLHLNYERITTSLPPLKGENKSSPPSEEGLGVVVTRLPIETMLPKRKNTGTGLFGKNEGEKENEELLKKLVPEIKLRVREGVIEIDELTSISGIPAEAWEYKLGNRSAIEWVLDQYKPYKSSDATIQAKFNNYNFFDYKEQVIKLLLQVIVVSVETMRIVKGL